MVGNILFGSSCPPVVGSLCLSTARPAFHASSRSERISTNTAACRPDAVNITPMQSIETVKQQEYKSRVSSSKSDLYGQPAGANGGAVSRPLLQNNDAALVLRAGIGACAERMDKQDLPTRNSRNSLGRYCTTDCGGRRDRCALGSCCPPEVGQKSAGVMSARARSAATDQRASHRSRSDWRGRVSSGREGYSDRLLLRWCIPRSQRIRCSLRLSGVVSCSLLGSRPSLRHGFFSMRPVPLASCSAM